MIRIPESRKHLNDTGCIRLYKSLSLLKERIDRLSVTEEGVKEVFGEESENEDAIVYDTTNLTCNCTFVVQNQCPCRHNLFNRESVQLPLIVKDMFHERYHLERSEDLEDERDNLGFNNNPDDDDGDEEDPDVMNVVDDGLAIEENVLTSNQKHNIVFPEMLKISNLVACRGTKKFLEYVEAFRKIEKIVRKGDTMFKIENS